MQITETSNDGLKREFKVVIPEGDVQKRVDSRLQQLGGGLKLPGFRPGKVPMPVLKQRFGKNVMGEVLEQAISDSSQKLLSDRGLRPAGQPRIEILSGAEKGDLEFSMAVELIPDIKVMDFKTVKLDRLTVDIPDAEVEQAIERAAQRYRKTQPLAAARPAQKDDVAVIDFVGKVDGAEFAGGSANDYHLQIGSGSFIPGFEEQLIGASAGDSKTVTVTFPAEYPRAEVAGKDATFEVTVKELRELAPLIVDDELAKEMGTKDLAELRENMNKGLAAEYSSLSRTRTKRQLLDILAEKHTFDSPAGLVETEFTAIWNQIEADKQLGRLDPDDVNKSEEELKKEYRDIAIRRVKLGLLLSEVGRINDVQVSNDEMGRAIMNEARRFPGQERKVIDYYQKTPQAMIQLRAPIYEDKVVDFILDQAEVTERKVSVEEFTKEMSGDMANPN
ncbi:MAG TPA: trigger factor [Verrucomicrobiae bacterium]|nr:trigger factor [Verrucomicrobiae bacterium]